MHQRHEASPMPQPSVSQKAIRDQNHYSVWFLSHPVGPPSPIPLHRLRQNLLPEQRGTVYHRLQHRRATFDEVAALSVEGFNKSSIARVKQLAWNTVDRWLEKAARECH